MTARGLRSASTTVGTSRASSVATATPTLTRPWRSHRPSTNELLNAGYSRSASAAALTTKSFTDGTVSTRSAASRRSSTIVDMSACTTTSNDGISDRDCVMRRAIVWPVVDNGTTVVGPLRSSLPGRRAAEDPARSTSSFRIRPPGPGTREAVQRDAELRRGAARDGRCPRALSPGRPAPERPPAGAATGCTVSIAVDAGACSTVGRSSAAGRLDASPSSATEPGDRLAECCGAALGHEDLRRATRPPRPRRRRSPCPSRPRPAARRGRTAHPAASTMPTIVASLIESERRGIRRTFGVTR